MLPSNYFSDSEVKYIQKVLTQHRIEPFIFAHINGIEKFSFLSKRLNAGKQHFLHHRKGDVRRRDVERPEAAYAGRPFCFPYKTKSGVFLHMPLLYAIRYVMLGLYIRFSD